MLLQILRNCNGQSRPTLRGFGFIVRNSNTSLLTTRGMASKLFQDKDIADAYVNFRPVYPSNLKLKILEYISNHNTKIQHDLAVDIGCGSGQSTLMWSDVFKSVLGTDVSQAQIDKAPKHVRNTTFKVETGERMSAKDNSVDLVTIAQAMHWVDGFQFYSEVNRVLKPGGVLAVYGYGNLTLDNSAASTIVSKEFYQDTLHKNSYWEPGREHIDNLYAEFTPLPFNEFERIDSLKMEKDWSLDHFIGYISSWSGYRAYMKHNPGSQILQEMKEKLRSIYENEETIHVSWPVFILLGRK